MLFGNRWKIWGTPKKPPKTESTAKIAKGIVIETGDSETCSATCWSTLDSP